MEDCMAEETQSIMHSCLAVKRGRTKFNQDLSPVSSHWNKAWDIDHYGGHK